MSADSPSLQDHLKRLDEIVKSLERDDIDLDRALALFEEGIGRLREARARLADAELRLGQLRQAADGSARVADLDR